MRAPFEHGPVWLAAPSQAKPAAQPPPPAGPQRPALLAALAPSAVLHPQVGGSAALCLSCGGPALRAVEPLQGQALLACASKSVGSDSFCATLALLAGSDHGLKGPPPQMEPSCHLPLLEERASCPLCLALRAHDDEAASLSAFPDPGAAAEGSLAAACSQGCLPPGGAVTSPSTLTHGLLPRKGRASHKESLPWLALCVLRHQLRMTNNALSTRWRQQWGGHKVVQEASLEQSTSKPSHTKLLARGGSEAKGCQLGLQSAKWQAHLKAAPLASTSSCQELRGREAIDSHHNKVAAAAAAAAALRQAPSAATKT